MKQKDPNIGVSVEQISVDKNIFERPINFDCLPILPTRNLVLLPEVTISVALKREAAIAVTEYCEKNEMPVGIICQTDPANENPTVARGLHRTGVVADILKIIELPDGEKTAIIRGRVAFKVLKTAKSPVKGMLCACTKPLMLTDLSYIGTPEFVAAMENVTKLASKIATMSGNEMAPVMMGLQNVDDPVMVINTIISHFPIDTPIKIQLLATTSLKERVHVLLHILLIREQELQIMSEVLDSARAELSEQQRRAFLQQQVETIQSELYGDSANDSANLRQRAEKAALPDYVRTAVEKEINKLERYNPQSPDYSVIYSYLDTLLSLPWLSGTDLNDDFDEAKRALNSEHCALDKVKERILEQLAVLINNPGGKAPILCLVGPPGVGKTSLGESIAKALGRNYQRVSLGGLHDESEIRGHRRTYIGAMPGRIIDAIKRAGSNNPVLVLDEIDKVGKDYKGDPAAAMLEVLDPEQNVHFHDNYIDLDFDLSHVLFIATANTLDTLSQPLLDRLEVIDISGYLAEEKIEIARRHLIRRNAAELGIAPDAFEITDEALLAVIDGYTSESGVRQLQKALAKIARRYIFAKLNHQPFPEKILPSHLKDILGVQRFTKDKYEGNDFPGVVTGLAWTRVGGEILLVETSLSPGKGERLSLTGNLGDVMKESATIALQWVKAHAAELGISPEVFTQNDIHIHFPEGAIPKDGPSAGITIATAIVSLLTGRRLRPRIAMTGEITLRGKVLAVGGIKEKILAAKRAGITDIIMSADNRKDFEDIDARYTAGLTIHFVETVPEVLSTALER